MIILWKEISYANYKDKYQIYSMNNKVDTLYENST